MRSTVDLNQKAAGDAFGLKIESSEPVVVQEVVYDKTYSAGYDSFGLYSLPVVEAEEEVAVEEQELAEPVKDFVLVKEEIVSASRFKESVSAGLEKVVKYSYEFNGFDVFAWHFNYVAEDSASKALGSALSGGLFKILEVGPAEIRGTTAHYFVSEKSEGYFWLSGNDLYVFIAAKGEHDIALGLGEMFVAGTPPAKEKAGLSTILLVLLALIVLIFVVRRLFKRSPKEEEAAAWAEMIPSAKPEKKIEKAKPKQKKPAKKKHKKAEEEKPEAKLSDKKEKQKKKPAKKKHKKEEKKKEKKHEEKKAEKEKKGPKISIKEIPRDKLTAQDLLDQVEDIPEYEDVFRHVDREFREIKPK
jgi:hypothetical protein